jgi:hypothetical protein
MYGRIVLSSTPPCGTLAHGPNLRRNDDPEFLLRRSARSRDGGPTNWTRRWFDAALKSSDELVTSLVVEAELCNGDYPSRPEAMNLIAGLPLLDLDEAVAEVVDAYLYHQLMPKDPAGDALHLAAASYHRCDFLVTWNCEHLANANKFWHIRRINTMLGIGCPVLVTPLELLDEETNDE